MEIVMASIIVEIAFYLLWLILIEGFTIEGNFDLLQFQICSDLDLYQKGKADK